MSEMKTSVNFNRGSENWLLNNRALAYVEPKIKSVNFGSSGRSMKIKKILVFSMILRTHLVLLHGSLEEHFYEMDSVFK